MFKLGLKIWSENVKYVGEIVRLWEDRCFDYIEIYIKPDTYNQFSDFWRELRIPYVIHAAHFGHGVNLSNADVFTSNEQRISEAKLFADKLISEKIIVHPGVGGSIEETIRQLNLLADERVVVENKPYFGFTKEQICVGYSPEQLEHIIKSTGLSFCLDFGHAIYAANAVGADRFGFVSQFLSLKPTIFHLTDGDRNGIQDRHLRYGKGNFELDLLVSMIPEEFPVTNEAEKCCGDSLVDFEEDAEYLQKIYCSTHVN